MSQYQPSATWGPSPPTRQRKGRQWLSVVLFVVLLAGSVKVVIVTLAGVCVVVVIRYLRRRQARQPSAGVAAGPADLVAVRAKVAAEGGGAFLGIAERGGWRLARSQRAVLLLGPPRSGKSSGLIIPTVLSCPGPVVSTSTKTDILAATAGARSRVGRVWEFDPTGHASSLLGEVLRWSPVSCARSWDGALMMARAMVAGAGVGAGTTDGTHWSKRAAALLAPLLHAAALAGLNIAHVVDWVMRHELDQPGILLAGHDAQLASATLTGLQNTEARERSSIFSAATDALEAYTSQGALAAATDPNFDAERFVRSSDSIYIHAPAEDQALAAPLVCGLLSEIRRATYRAHATGARRASVLFALDEAANIAPLAELPQIASEGGGQGISLIAAFQDLSQARNRWGQLADGF